MPVLDRVDDLMLHVKMMRAADAFEKAEKVWQENTVNLVTWSDVKEEEVAILAAAVAWRDATQAWSERVLALMGNPHLG